VLLPVEDELELELEPLLLEDVVLGEVGLAPHASRSSALMPTPSLAAMLKRRRRSI